MASEIVIFSFHGNVILSLQHSCHICLEILLQQHELQADENIYLQIIYFNDPEFFQQFCLF